MGRRQIRDNDNEDTPIPPPPPGRPPARHQADRIQGTVVRLVYDRGFGFITGDDRKEYFFHSSQCDDGLFETLTPGQSRVEFSCTQTDKGPRAILVGAV
jgi:cold shock CspA family protein